MKLDLKYEDRIYKGYCEGVYINPLEFNSVDEFTVKDLIHKVPSLEDFLYVVNVLLKPGGKAVITAPYYTSMSAWAHPETRRTINEGTFIHAQKKWREDNPGLYPDLTCDFTIDYQFAVHGEWQNRTQEAMLFAIKHYWNVVKEITVILTKI